MKFLEHVSVLAFTQLIHLLNTHCTQDKQIETVWGKPVSVKT